MVGVPVTSGNSAKHNVITNTTQIPTNKEYLIQGTMLKCETLITMEEWETQPAEYIKEKMLRMMLEEMMRGHYMEFTMNKDQQNFNMIRVRARIFVTPDSQVRLLREKGSL